MAALASTVEGATNTDSSSTPSLISVNVVPLRNFYKSTVVHAKLGHVSQTTPLSGVICHPFGKTWYLTALASAIPEMSCHKNFKRVTWRNHAPFRDGLSTIGWNQLRPTCIPNKKHLRLLTMKIWKATKNAKITVVWGRVMGCPRSLAT